MRMFDIIEKKRDGGKLSLDEINYFVSGTVDGSIPDYMVTALLMAIFLKGMDSEETANLTLAMANSGDTVDLSQIKGIKMDKHSTGGVGDKTTLVTCPIVAACGVTVAKMSGRGLGHTGGTLDKLESIPGLKTEMTLEDFISQVRKTGLAIAGQTGNFAPADKIMYSLRNATATINSIPLIASSIMSKKIAAGANGVVLDVKTGSGAFMKELDKSIELAQAMVNIGEKTGRKTVAYITGMDIPLGLGIGNALETVEAIETLKGRGPKDLQVVALELAARMIEIAADINLEECREMARDAIVSQKALGKFRDMIERQGGNPDVIDDYTLFPEAAVKYEVKSEAEGYIQSMNTNAIGTASMLLGAGRAKKEDKIDHAAGIILNKKTRMKVEKGEVIATFYTNDDSQIKDSLAIFSEAVAFSQTCPPPKPLIMAYVDEKTVHRYTE